MICYYTILCHNMMIINHDHRLYILGILRMNGYEWHIHLELNDLRLEPDLFTRTTM